MEWFYSDGKSQFGPVSETEFNNLIGTGAITSNTLVWNQGMPNWTPWGQVNPAPSVQPMGAPAPAASTPAWGALPGQQACTVCGRFFPEGDLLRYESSMICAECKPGFFQRMREGAVELGVLAYAGFWIRFAASFIDGIITNVVNQVVLVGVTAVVGQMDPFGGGGNSPGAVLGALAAMLLVPLLLSMAYYVYFVGKHGATPGKMLLRLRVVRADGTPVGYGLATGRYFAYMLSGMILGIGYVMAAFDEEKRALHDRVCNTRVIRMR